MNEHLSERFSRSRRPPASDHYQGPDQAQVLILPQKLNTKVREYEDDAVSRFDENHWTALPELPTTEELRGTVPSNPHGHYGSGSTSSTSPSSSVRQIPNNQPLGPFVDKNDYLGVQYELIREDALRHTREAISAVRDRPEAMEITFDGKIGIYNKVHIHDLIPSTRGMAVRVTFSLLRTGKRILWEQSKRLVTGSLIILTPADDMFQKKTVVATVAARPLSGLLLNPPEIDIYFARLEEVEIDTAVEWIMIQDNGGLYESGRHTMLGLQHMMNEPFPLSEHLISVKKEVSIARDIAKSPRTDLTSVIVNTDEQSFEDFNITKPWPSNMPSALDQSQLDALRRILTKELAIVQGPPGTGKTHVSVQAVKIWLANRKDGDPPIVVACQTNHAIDQLLRHISEDEPNYVRLGGRSKDPEIKKRTLFEVRQMISQAPPAGCLFGQSVKKMKELEREIGLLLAPLRPGQRPLDPRILENFKLLTKAQADSLEEGARAWVIDAKSTSDGQYSPWKVWLGDKLVSVPHRQVEEDLFGFDYEAVDLEFEQLKESEAEAMAKDDDEIEALKGTIFTIADNFTCRKTTGMDKTAKASLKQQDMWQIPEAKRGAVYRHLQRELKQCIRDAIRVKATSFAVQVKNRKIGQWEKDEAILKELPIIGMTTTGLSKHRCLISALGVKTILIEEAAETLEAPVTVACIPTLQQLVLVGDHKQLRPHTHVTDHEDHPHYLNISLFERMANNGVEFSTLVKQRRMIPEIRRLLFPIYQGIIKDHPFVEDKDNRPDVPGMGGVNSFFFTHEWPEQRDDQMSIINPMEADMIVKFVEYLVCQGVDPMNITVLCFYNGQRKKILSSLRNSIPLNGCRFKVVTVDSYQGEENQILLLSLARHNERGQMGFLNVENRVCVALSRAQCGLYIFGGGRMLYQAEANYPKHRLQIWQQVIGIFSARVDGIGLKKEVPRIEPSRLDTSLPLRCRNHNNVTLVKDPEDFDDLHGGCKVACGGTLPCGHACTLKCHPFPHEDVNCEVCRTIKKPTDNAPKILLGRAPSSGPETSPSRSSEGSWKTFASQEANRVKGLHDNFVPSTQRVDTPVNMTEGELLLDFGDSEEVCDAVGGTDLLTLGGTVDGSIDGSDVSTVKVKKDGRVQVTTMHRFGKAKAENGKGKVTEEVSLLD